MDFIFPAVFYKDEENDDYLVAFEDVRIYCEGKTIEDAFFTARRYLRDFCKLSLKMFGEVREKPRTYLEVKQNHKKDVVLLVDAEVKALSKKQEEELLDIE